MPLCPNCNESVASQERIYCPSCGAELPTNDSESSTINYPADEEQAEPQKQQENTTKRRPNIESKDRHEHHESPRANNQRTEDPNRSQRPQPDSAANGRNSRANAGSSSSQRPLNQEANQPQQQTESENSRGRSERSSQPKQQRKNTSRSYSESILGGSSRGHSEPVVNDTTWSIGWHPFLTVGGIGFVSFVITILFELDATAIGILTVIGFGVGAGVWYMGVAEINNNYRDFRDAFHARSASRAENRLGLKENEITGSFDFRSHGGNSPMLVEPSKLYRADHMVLSDVSLSIDKNSEYNMKSREANSTGTTKNIYYDNIESISTNDEGHRTYLKIVTSKGEDLRTATVDQPVAEQAQGRLRSKMREVRRGQATSQQVTDRNKSNR